MEAQQALSETHAAGRISPLEDLLDEVARVAEDLCGVGAPINVIEAVRTLDAEMIAALKKFDATIEKIIQK